MLCHNRRASMILNMQGWSWVEEEWSIDTQGIADDAVDVNGWSYAVGFSHLKMPPAAGSGKYRKVSSMLSLTACCVYSRSAALRLPCMLINHCTFTSANLCAYRFETFTRRKI